MYSLRTIYSDFLTISRCKHRHTEHDPVNHKCVKPGCSCVSFYSPWVCNCDHPWSEHEQKIHTRTVCVMINPNSENGDDQSLAEVMNATSELRIQSGAMDGKMGGYDYDVTDDSIDFRDADLTGWEAVKRGEDS